MHPVYRRLTVEKGGLSSSSARRPRSLLPLYGFSETMVLGQLPRDKKRLHVPESDC